MTDLFQVPESRDELSIARSNLEKAETKLKEIEESGCDDTGEATRRANREVFLAKHQVQVLEDARIRYANGDDSLFSVPEILSPRLKWMRENEIEAKTTESMRLAGEAKFCAFHRDQDLSEALHVGSIGFGDTEEEACADLCRVNKLEGWK